ncbi:TPA: glycosyl hydrolase family 8 [Streptococcus suis]|nr:glycosyl hydrolase family 8 [Streptococcus suis]
MVEHYGTSELNTLTPLQAIVLAGDYSYIRQIETTLKSLLYHNCHLKIYIFNQDIPKEWFSHYQCLLQQIGSELIDVKLLDIGFNNSWTVHSNLHHINHMTFARYYIPQFVKEDKVLYLDSDLVVTSDLTEFFEKDIQNYYLAASRAAFGYGIGFNAGVMLINNKRWKQENIQKQLIDLTNRDFKNVPEGDQTILNRLLGQRYLRLDDTYNFQIGYDRGAFHYGHRHLFQDKLDPLPLILHYVSADKPWNTYSSGRLREIWWKYHLLEWSEILEKWRVLYTPTQKKSFRGLLLVITNTHLLQNVTYLIDHLPDYQFHIAAFTDMAENLKQLSSKENVFLHPRVIGYILEDMIKNCDIYLDINHGTKLNELLEHVITNQKPVLSFDNIASPIFEDYSHRQTFSHHQPESLITAIRLLSK